MRRFFLIVLLLGGWASAILAQEGRWKGTLPIPGNPLTMFIDLAQTPGGWEGKLDLPQQNIQQMALANLRVTTDSVSFRMPDVPGNASYRGALKADKITGTFTQGGYNLALEFVQSSAADSLLLARKVDRLRNLVDSLRDGLDVPGVGFGLVYRGETLIVDGFGYRNVERQEPVTARTIFAIGSSTKAFTAAGLALLADEGKLDWDKPVRDYLPEFQLKDPWATQAMTAVDLLTHRSGLPRHDILWYLTDFDRRELLRRLRYLEPTASLRTKFQYQNLMYMTAGILTEELSGAASWEAFVKQRLFDPLGMATANFSTQEMEQVADRATGYQDKDKQTTPMPYHAIDAIGPAGSINASVQDMLHWVRLQLNGGKLPDGTPLLSKANLRKLHQPHMLLENPLLPLPGISYPSYGLGWFIYDDNGKKIVEHGGNIDGFSALVYLVPEADLGMVILTNKNATLLGYLLARYALDMLLEREPNDYLALYQASQQDNEEDTKKEEAKPVPNTRPQHALADYAGKYEHPAYGQVIITAQKEKLQLQYYRLSTPLLHWHYDTFRATEALVAEAKYTFATDEEGRVSALETIVDPSLPLQRFERLPDDHLTSAEFLRQFAGRYLLDATTITIELIGDQLKLTVPANPPTTCCLTGAPNSSSRD